MKKLRLAILGQGRSGRNIHGNYLLTDTDRFEIAYVVEPIQERRERAVKEYGCIALEDYKQLLDKSDIDFVVNASPSHLHFPITLDLLSHGFNVLCEKPFARTAAQVEEMIAKSKEKGKMLAVFQQSRFAPYFEQMCEVIKSGVLGRIIQISVQFSGYARRWDWQCCREFNGGNLYNTGPHPVDQVLHLLDYQEGNPNVVCYMDRVNSFGDAEDYVKLILTAPQRPVIDVEISSCNAYPSFLCNIMGSTGGMKGGEKEVQWRWFDPAEAPHQELIKTPLCDEDGLPSYCRDSLKWHEDRWEIPAAGTFTVAVGKLYDTVYRNLTEGTPLLVTPEQVRQQIWVMEECLRQNPVLPRA